MSKKIYIIVTSDGLVEKIRDISKLREILQEHRGQLRDLYSTESDEDDARDDNPSSNSRDKRD